MHQAIDCAPNCFDPLRLPPWPGGMREAIKSGHRALGATVGAVWRIVGLLLTKPYPLSRSDIPLPTGAARFRRTLENSMFLHRDIAANVDVVGAVLGLFLVILEPSSGSS